MAYEPSNPPSEAPADIAAWALREFTELARQLNDGAQVFIEQKSYSAPAKPRAGMLVNADGTSWHPGGGAGMYQYLGGAWVKL